MTLLIIVTIGYFGVNIGEVYFRYFSYQDAMKQEARFAAHKSDDEILQRLRARADSLGLPPAAQRVHIRRAGTMIFIWADYFETLELPGTTRDVEMSAHAERAF
ncbi:MAG TPA: hypothetical protein VIQ74_16735 [Gemmatimonadaceae bacterium]|jgi:hypothetical protein